MILRPQSPLQMQVPVNAWQLSSSPGQIEVPVIILQEVP